MSTLLESGFIFYLCLIIPLALTGKLKSTETYHEYGYVALLMPACVLLLFIVLLLCYEINYSKHCPSYFSQRCCVQACQEKEENTMFLIMTRQ